MELGNSRDYIPAKNRMTYSVMRRNEIYLVKGTEATGLR